MSSSDNNEPSAQHAQDEVANPFVSFRRFADEQVSVLLHSLIGLPSAFAHNPSESRRSDFDDDARLSRRLDFDENVRTSRSLDFDEDVRFPPQSDFDNDVQLHIACQLERARESEEVKKIMSICKRAYEEADTGDDEEASLSRCPYRHFDPEMVQVDQRLNEEVAPPVFETSSPSAADLDSQACSHQAASLWPIVYVANSLYSPFHLERISPFSEHGKKWRDAFEDLLAAKSSKTMPEDDSHKSHGSGAAWMNSMFERGILGDGCTGSKDPYQSEDLATIRKSNINASEGDVTELDLYERFLGSQYPSKQKSSSTNGPVSKTSAESNKPGLISTLTTTERNTLPDGSTHTKVVLKKRFADGREESTETVHTTYDSQQSSHKNFASSNPGGLEEGTHDSEPAAKSLQSPKKGWFWS